MLKAWKCYRKTCSDFHKMPKVCKDYFTTSWFKNVFRTKFYNNLNPAYRPAGLRV